MTAGKHYTYPYRRTGEVIWQRLIFWAANGMIQLQDTGDEAKANTEGLADLPTKSISRHDFFDRVRAIQEEAMEYAKNPGREEDYRRARNFWEDAKTVLREAFHQGDPLDPAVRAHRRRHRSNNRIVVPSSPSILLPKGPAAHLLNGDASHISITGL